jgi:hypothetical protein
VRYSSLALVREALPHQSHLRRHLPFVLFLMGLTGLVIALSRPVANVLVPYGQNIIILALDVSRSMCSTDVQPNRLEAAKDSARLIHPTANFQLANRHRRLCRVCGTGPGTHNRSEMLQDAIEPDHSTQDGRWAAQFLSLLMQLLKLTRI